MGLVPAAGLMRTVAVLAVVAALLAGFLLFVDRRPTGDGDRDGTSGRARLVDAFDRAAVRRITIARAGAAAFSLERQPPGHEPSWKEMPGDAPADAAAVEDLLGAIDLAETTRTADLTDAAAGLAPPKVTVVLDQPRAPITLALGRADVGQGVFARAGRSPSVRVAPRHLLDLADRGPEAFRDRRLVPVAAADVARVEWHQAGGTEARLLSRDDGRWKNDAGNWVANGRVEESLRRLLALRAERYLPAAAPIGAISRLEITVAGPRKLILSAGGGPCDSRTQTFVERDAEEGTCVSSEQLDGLFRALEAARAPDRRLVSAPPSAVQRIEITEGTTRLVLARASAGSWRLEAPKASYLIDQRAVDDWLLALGRVDAQPPPAVSQPHVRHLIVEGRYREQAEVSPGDPGYPLVDPDPLRFRDRAVLDFAHFDARELRRSAEGRTIEIASRDGDDWRAVAPADAAVDRTDAARVVGALGNLRAEAFQAEAPAGAPEVTLEIAVQPPGEPAPIRHTVELYKKKEAPGCTGRLDRDATFSVARAVCDELRLGLVK